MPIRPNVAHRLSHERMSLYVCGTLSAVIDGEKPGVGSAVDPSRKTDDVHGVEGKGVRHRRWNGGYCEHLLLCRVRLLR